ncbi:hypothetical protein Syun_022262 [Stephania yunnanensis]|uniref:Katanin p80 WD40 repeat-containing subunit B1 homolog n=1 Tax=Stephania yunnanensis TaxID=152371 RepID=A0AAP0F6N1_9MAGN
MKNAKMIREHSIATREQRMTREQRREGEKHNDAEVRGRPGSRGARVRNTTTQRHFDDKEQRHDEDDDLTLITPYQNALYVLYFLLNDLYDPEEFVAHASNVNCLKIGRKSSRVLVTGGEDHKVNLWAIGKPNAILSLSGHSSAVESVNFDSSEVLVAAGAASGTIKLWDLEEAKVVRTLTGHRSNCISVDFHPFGEFFASGSLDTNLKIWDIRRKGCIHTYKGHTRGVNAIRFTPDGRWVVSGGEDNSVKLWDLTAGKLLHDFKYHEGQVQCIDFHPHEFLLATGSADRTVKFWDLETFELIGSAGPEVFSWEPIRCHDAVDVGWSRLSDLNIHEGKLLGCSYNQSCVGVWVVDISRIEPYVISSTNRSDCLEDSKSSSNAILSGLTDNSGKNSLGRLSISTNSDPTAKEAKLLGRLSVSQNPETMVKETKPFTSTGSVPGTPQKVGLNAGPKSNTGSLASAPSTGSLRRNSLKTHSTNTHVLTKSEVVPVIVPRTSTRIEQAADSRKEICAGGRTAPCFIQSKVTDVQNILTNMGESDKPNVSLSSGLVGCKTTELNEVTDQNFNSIVEGLTSSNSMPERNGIDATRCIAHGKYRLNTSMEPPAGRSRSLVANWEKRERSSIFESSTSTNLSDTTSIANGPYNLALCPQTIVDVVDEVVATASAASTVALDSDATVVLEARALVTAPVPTNWARPALDIREPRSQPSLGPRKPKTARGDRIHNFDRRRTLLTMPGRVGEEEERNGGRLSSSDKQTVSASDDDAIADLLELHDQFLGSMQDRLTKLQWFLLASRHLYLRRRGFIVRLLINDVRIDRLILGIEKKTEIGSTMSEVVDKTVNN